VMKKSVAYLFPFIEEANKTCERKRKGKGKILMATVKGDVHDIGKNIVGIVLQCNNYEVIDLGVMAPAARILETARKENVDIIGLSGLITPSLHEMARVAEEMQREGFDIPLLVGGATTSELHTAVKIAPCYNGPVVHGKDASVTVGIVARLLHPVERKTFAIELKARQEELRQAFTRRRRPLCSLAEARQNPLLTDWTAYTPPAPAHPGRHVLRDYPIEELIEFIDWSMFLYAWDLKGRYPEILEHPDKGEQARKLIDDARELIDDITSRALLHAHAVFAILPAVRRGDDILLLDSAASAPRAVFRCLRQQMRKPPDSPNLCLADFVAPPEAGVCDYVGLFAVTAGHGARELSEDFVRRNDDYRAILSRILADRLAEAMAERLHQRVRTEFWAYARDERLTLPEMLALKYRGIRPAPGYPACPDHAGKVPLFDLLDAPRHIGVKLTESFMMVPEASVCGLYFAHPESRYFDVGRIREDQLADYAARSGLPLDTARRRLETRLA